MKKLRTAIYLTGAYTLSKPILMQYNFYKISQKSDDDTRKRISTTYNKQGKQWALVTGGSEGIGKTMATDLAKSGFNVVIASRSEQKLQKAKQEIQKDCPGSKIEIFPIDLANETDYSKMMGIPNLRENLGIVINCAGQLMYEKQFLE